MREPVPPVQHRLRIAAVWVALVLAAVGAQLWVGPALFGDRGPAGAAQWLWAETNRFDPHPLAFFLVRDFEISKTAPPAGRLALLGDEEYSVFLNGGWAAAGRYVPGAALEIVDVTSLLRPGRNRLVVELRSATGSGGFVARLADGEGHTLVATDERWQVLRREPDSFLPTPKLTGAESPAVLGAIPIGRWGRPGASPLRTALERERGEQSAWRLRDLVSGEWREVTWQASSARPLGSWVQLDWGEVVGGYLALEFAGGEGGIALIGFADAPADSAPLLADAIAVRPLGRRHWYDVEPRRFRWVAVLSPDPVVSAKVWPDRAALPAQEIRARETRGVLGIDPPRLRSAAEDVVRREFECVARRARGEAC